MVFGEIFVNSLIFVDESGVLARDPNQPLFGIGMLKIADTSKLYEALKAIKDQLKAREFRFSQINKSTFARYQDLIRTYFSFPECYYSCLVLDKLDPGIQIGKYFSNTWDAYIGYSKLLIKNNLEGDTCCVIADYLSKPKFALNYYEESIRSIDRTLIFNATMLESHSSLLIQMVDVLTGSVLYDFRQMKYPGTTRNQTKARLVQEIRYLLGLSSLAQNATVSSPSYFSIREFRP